MVRRVPIALVLLLSMVACESPKPKNSYRAMVYSRGFAENFGLKPNGVHTLDAGLQAVVVRVIERTGYPPSCRLDLYVDDSLQVAYPVGSEGIQRYDDDEDPFFFVRDAKAIVPTLSRWSARLGNMHSGGCEKPVGEGDCVTEEGGPSAYSRHLMPGAALVTYKLGCHLFDPKYAPVAMWLLKEGRDSKELNPRTGDTAATYRFTIPTALFDPQRKADPRGGERLRQAIAAGAGPVAVQRATVKVTVSIVARRDDRA